MKADNEQNTQRPLASVIIVDFNGGPILEDAIDSMAAQTIADQLQVILVDNGSEDGVAERIARERSDFITYVRSNENLGFAGGNNLGFRHAEGTYLLLLNNDAVADPDWAEQLINTAKDHPGVGMVTSRILQHDNPTQLDNAGHDIYPDGLNKSRGNDLPDGPEYAARRETLFASGCAALYDRGAVMKVGGFDEDFFAYGDDADLGLKLRLLGLKCLYEPSARVLHRSSATAGRFSLQKIFWIERNRVWILIKYFPVSWILFSPYYTVRRLLGAWSAAAEEEGVAQEVRKAHSALDLGKTILWAWANALMKLPKMWQRRRTLQQMRTMSGMEWKSLLKRFILKPEEMFFSRKRDLNQ